MKNKELTRSCFLEVDLDKLIDNIRTIKRNISLNSSIIAVVKANAYGFGIKKIVDTLILEGIDYFAVATLQEALEIRKYHSDIKIMILGYTDKKLFKKAIENRVELSIYTKDDVLNLEKIASEINSTAQINIPLETGMNRIGFVEDDKFIENMETIKNSKNIEVSGAFSHFAAADTDPCYTRKQFDKFIRMTRIIENIGIEIPYKHISNSMAIMNFKEFNLDAVRPGIIMYGSSEGLKKEGFDLKYIGSLKAKISNIKTIKKDEKVSYGLTYTCDRDTKVATLPIGYADGVVRILSNKIDVIVNGKRCPVIGRICMDQMMVDVTNVDCDMNTICTIIGRDGDEEITIEEVAGLAGEIATSYSTHFSSRIPRVYIKNGQVDEIYDEIGLL
ncbi:MAG: alanine racemase [Peptoniphilus duerdenii]|uniref:alanine racemase n=1 Tax=Peptoniphilus duerdenii TaxID=507750 RepID=UPI00254AFDFE|nr:alanine racemase [Peptoniphilus duerdenii]MDK8275936.1 alanine racemase [Peptoniphilus duerdenii]